LCIGGYRYLNDKSGRKFPQTEFHPLVAILAGYLPEQSALIFTPPLLMILFFMTGKMRNKLSAVLALPAFH
jgi:hypothetical protein